MAGLRIAVLPGDGIGREIVAQAVAVLDALRAEGRAIIDLTVAAARELDMIDAGVVPVRIQVIDR